MTKGQLTEPARGMDGSGAGDQRNLVGADIECVSREFLDDGKRRIADNGRRRRPAFQEVLNATTRITTVDDVSCDDAIAGALGSVCDAARTGTRIKQRGGAIKFLDSDSRSLHQSGSRYQSLASGTKIWESRWRGLVLILYDPHHLFMCRHACRFIQTARS